MARSKWKFSFFNTIVWRKFFLKKYKRSKKAQFISFNRATAFPVSFYKSNIHVYKGNIFRKIKIRRFYIGKKAGEFAFTKKPFFFPLKKKKR